MSDSKVWHVFVDGKQKGPYPTGEVVTRILSGSYTGETQVFTTGMKNWTPIKNVPEFAAASGESAPPPPPPSYAEPPGSDVIDFEVFGSEMQFVEIELDAGETVIAEAGAMMHMEEGIEMEARMGDGSKPQQGLMGKLLSAGKRLLTRESLFMTWFTNRGSRKQRVAFGAPYPGKIIHLDLRKLGGQILCQKDSFLCAARGTSVEVAFNKRLGVGLFGGEGFILQKLTGDGNAFVHAGGTIVEKQLRAGQTLRVDTGCIVAFTKEVQYDIQLVKGVGSILFGGEGLFFATVTGPGTVWLQSLPFSRLADRIYSAMPQNSGGRGVGEGSVLGGLGDMLGGD